MARSYVCEACQVPYFLLLPKNCYVLHVKVSARAQSDAGWLVVCAGHRCTEQPVRSRQPSPCCPVQTPTSAASAANLQEFGFSHDSGWS